MKSTARKLTLRNRKGIPKITASSLRGGMQDRLHRQQILKYNKDLEIYNKKLIERDNISDGFTTQSLEDFHEPAFRRIRRSWGFN